MEDDLFSQLSSLFEDRPKNSSTGFGGTPLFSNDGISSAGRMSENDAMFRDDGMIVPDIKPTKKERDKKLIVILDDDFSTLDLMKIYLQRDYEVMTFDNPKNAIFFLNGTVPDLIFIDCYLNVMNTKRVLDIIRTYKELEGTPIVYLAEPSEHSAMLGKLPDGVLDVIDRPVKRGELQNILDKFLKAHAEDEELLNGDTPDEKK